MGVKGRSRDCVFCSLDNRKNEIEVGVFVHTWVNKPGPWSYPF